MAAGITLIDSGGRPVVIAVINKNWAVGETGIPPVVGRYRPNSVYPDRFVVTGISHHRDVVPRIEGDCAS